MLNAIQTFPEDAITMSDEANILQEAMRTLAEKSRQREQKYRSAANGLASHCQRVLEAVTARAEEIIQSAEERGMAIVAAAKEEARVWKAEKERMADVMRFEHKVKLDVGRSRFTTSLATLRRFPDSMIEAMFSGRHALPLDDEGYFFIDRDGTHFRHILNFLRSPETFCNKGMTVEVVSDLTVECAYYGLAELGESAVAAVIPVAAELISEPPAASAGGSKGSAIDAPRSTSVFAYTTGTGRKYVLAPIVYQGFGRSNPQPSFYTPTVSAHGWGGFYHSS
jgi:hypothetical protein